MKLLILGGTVFLGRHLAEAARTRGHELTLFNRGRSNPGLFEGVEELHGDRDGDLGPLAGRRWDAVIDTSGYVPRVVRESARMLVDAVDHYCFISSISVYESLAEVGVDETAPLATLADSDEEEVTGETYGPLKVLCEQVVQELYPNGALIIRPGLIVGPYDPTDRFTYWPVRVADGGEVLAPGSAARPIQFIDARDLASWTVQLIEKGATGVYNATGPGELLPMGDLLATARRVSGSNAYFRWVDGDFLLEEGVQPWTELPLWLPGEEAAGFGTVNVKKAIAAGLRFRPLAETVADTLEWAASRNEDHNWRAGLARERELELLAAWNEKAAHGKKDGAQAQ